MNDEREGLLSASAGDIAYHCSGYLKLKQRAPAQKETEVAAAGTRMHEAKELGITFGLDPSEENVVDNLDELEKQALEKWMGDLGSFAKAPKAMREQRLWITGLPENKEVLGKRVASAKLDVHWVAVEHKAALAIDFKTGFKDVTDAARNIQTRIQAVSMWHEYPFLTSIRVGVAQGRLRGGKLDLADYDVPALEAAERELQWHLWLSEQPHAARVPGRWCTYCPCKTICPEAWSYAMLASVISAHLEKCAESIGDLRAILAYIWRRKAITEKVFDQVTDDLKALPAETLAELGLALKPNSDTTELADAQTVFAHLFKNNLVTDAVFRDCVKALKGRIEKAVIPVIVDRDNCKVGEAKKKLEAILEPVSTKKPKAPSLVEVGTS